MTAPRYAIEFDAEIAVDAATIEALRALLDGVFTAEAVEQGSALTVLLADDVALRALNRDHHGADEPTDVLSFPADEGDPFPDAPGEPRYLGDIAVSIETVRRQAAELGLALDLELRHVILHGALHLLGFDHLTPADEAAMRAREERELGSAIHADARVHDD